MKKYSIGIYVHDPDDGTPSALADVYISAEQAVEVMGILLADANKTTEEEVEEVEEIEEIEAVVKVPVKTANKSKKPRLCSNCQQPGHIARKCPRFNGTPKDAPDEDEESDEARPPTPTPEGFRPRSVREQVKELTDGGLSKEEIFELLPNIDMFEISAVYDDLTRT